MVALQEFPKNRAGHSMHLVGETLITWGGCYLDIKCFDDLYLYNIRYHHLNNNIGRRSGHSLRLLVVHHQHDQDKVHS